MTNLTHAVVVHTLYLIAHCSQRDVILKQLFRYQQIYLQLFDLNFYTVQLHYIVLLKKLYNGVVIIIIILLLLLYYIMIGYNYCTKT